MKPRDRIDLKGEMKERMIDMVPAEPLWAVFTPEVITNLRQIRSPSQRLQTRLRILDARGLNPNPVNRELRAHKAAWEAYLTAAFAIGLFEGPDGVELSARLTGTDDDNFFSAISECFGAWYLAGRRRLELVPRPRGQGAKCLEYSIKCESGDINVEVKAPYRPLGDEFFWGDDADLLEKALQSANRQFAKGQRNLLVVHPRLRLSIFPQFCRMPIERAFIGEDVIRIPLNPATGGPAGPTHTAFKQSGRFVKLWPGPRYTRISAVLSLNGYEEGGEVKPRALMVHNPNAEMPLPRDMWQGIPEFFLDSNRWRWSDA
jgi:hypothetical protein